MEKPDGPVRVGRRPTCLRIHRRKAVTELPLPGSGPPSPAASDPLPTPQALHTGHRNRSKPPFKLRQRCASILPDWTPANEGKACVHLRPSALRGNRRRGRSHPQRAARTSARIRSAPRLVTRPPTAVCARRSRVPVAAARAANSLTFAQHPPPGHSGRRSDLSLPQLPVGPGEVGGALHCPPTTRQGRWSYYPFP